VERFKRERRRRIFVTGRRVIVRRPEHAPTLNPKPKPINPKPWPPSRTLPQQSQRRRRRRWPGREGCAGQPHHVEGVAQNPPSRGPHPVPGAQGTSVWSHAV